VEAGQLLEKCLCPSRPNARKAKHVPLWWGLSFGVGVSRLALGEGLEVRCLAFLSRLGSATWGRIPARLLSRYACAVNRVVAEGVCENRRWTRALHFARHLFCPTAPCVRSALPSNSNAEEEVVGNFDKPKKSALAITPEA